MGRFCCPACQRQAPLTKLVLLFAPIGNFTQPELLGTFPTASKEHIRGAVGKLCLDGKLVRVSNGVYKRARVE